MASIIMGKIEIQHSIDRIELLGFNSLEGQEHWALLKEALLEIDRDEINDLEVELHDTQKQLEAKQDDVDDLESEVEDLKEEIQDLQNQIEKAKDALNA